MCDLVMLKVDPKFKLDQAFRGPYRVHQVTSTCAQSTNQKIFVSLQRLSCCEGGASLDEVQPWLGHGLTSSNDGTVNTSDDREITTRGRRVVKPARYRDPSSFPEGSAFQQGGGGGGGGGGCKARDLKSSDT